jgi:cytochrome c
MEGEDLDYPYLSGPEMQILDNSCHPDAKIDKHQAGDLYDLIASEPKTVKPAGEWNTIKIRIENGDLTFWQNGTVVVDTKLWTPEWDEMVAGSKFAKMPKFGTAKKGKIVLQDHGDPVWFRNIKARNLDVAE